LGFFDSATFCCDWFTDHNSQPWILRGDISMPKQFKSSQSSVPPELRLYTTAEAAAILNVSLRTLQGWVRDGALPHVRLGEGGRLVRIRAQDLEDFIQQNYRQS
jgi:excisionase family DNA binding protein